MWELYRRMFIWNQCLVLVALIVARFFFNWPTEVLVLLFLVMQFGAVLGAWWGNRIRRQVDRANDDLPLKPR